MMSSAKYKNRQKWMHDSQRIDTDPMKTQGKSPDDTDITSFPPNFPAFRQNMTYQEMLKVDSFFRKNQIHYISDDPVLGLALVSVAVDKFNIIHSHIFTCCGPLSLPLITPENQDVLRVVVSHLPHDRRSKTFQVIAMAILQYFTFVPLHVKKEILRQYNASINNTDQHRRIAFDEMHAGDIAGHCQLLKLSDLSSILCSMLQKRKFASFNMDVILPDNSMSIPLFSKLQEITSGQQRSEDSSFERKNVFSGPIEDNYIEHDKKRISILDEILRTEQNYIDRLRHLVLDYVLPLRIQAKTLKNPPLGLYDVNRMFPLSLNDIISVNSAFLQDFMKAETEIEKANSCVTHFSQFKKVYAKYLELSVDFESILRHNLRNPKFRDFVDNQKYKAERNISIRELIMEPVQRIPRYSLFLETIILNTHPKSPALAPFKKALSIVKDIAQMKIMEAEERSKLFQKLMGHVSGFPPELISNSRYFITAIDAIEILPPFIDSSDKIYCTLLLFSDCLVILKKSSHISIANELISNEEETSLHKSQYKQGLFKFTNLTSRKDILFQGWANIDDLEIELDENNDTNIWIIAYSPIRSCLGSETWGSFSEHKISAMSESKHHIISFIEKFYKTKAKNKTSENFISEIEKNNINIICNVYKASEYKKERKKSEIAIQYNHQSFVGNIDKKFPKMNISGLFLIEASLEMYRLDFYTPFSWKISPQKFQQLDVLLEDLFQKAISFQKFLKFSESSKNTSFLISKYKFFLSCLFRLNLVSSSAKTLFPAISSSNSNKRINPILGSKQSLSKNLTSLSLNNYVPEFFIKRKDSFFQSNFLKPNDEKYLSKIKNKTLISSMEIIKDKNIFYGIETFVYTLCCIEDFDSISTLTYSESEIRDSIELSNEIAKNPQKDYAVLGSPLKISYAAFKHYVKTHIAKKIGPILPYKYIKSCLNIIDKTDPIDEKISKIHDISLHLPQENYIVLYLIIYLTLHVLNKAYKGKCLNVLLLIISESLVPTYNGPSFVPVLKFMAHNFSQIFYEFTKNNFESISTVDSASSVFLRNSSHSGIASSFTSSFYEEPFILPDTYASNSNIDNDKNISLSLKKSLPLNSIQKDISKESFHKNKTSSPFIAESMSHLKTIDSHNVLNVEQKQLKTSFLKSNKNYCDPYDNIGKKENL